MSFVVNMLQSNLAETICNCNLHFHDTMLKEDCISLLLASNYSLEMCNDIVTQAGGLITHLLTNRKWVFLVVSFSAKVGCSVLPYSFGFRGHFGQFLKKVAFINCRESVLLYICGAEDILKHAVSCMCRFSLFFLSFRFHFILFLCCFPCLSLSL